jgi:hypothetical protein
MLFSSNHVDKEHANKNIKPSLCSKGFMSLNAMSALHNTSSDALSHNRRSSRQLLLVITTWTTDRSSWFFDTCNLIVHPVGHVCLPLSEHY